MSSLYITEFGVFWEQKSLMGLPNLALSTPDLDILFYCLKCGVELEETLHRLQEHSGVQGIIVVDLSGWYSVVYTEDHNCGSNLWYYETHDLTEFIV